MIIRIGKYENLEERKVMVQYYFLSIVSVVVTLFFFGKKTTDLRYNFMIGNKPIKKLLSEKILKVDLYESKARNLSIVLFELCALLDVLVFFSTLTVFSSSFSAYYSFSDLNDYLENYKAEKIIKSRRK